MDSIPAHRGTSVVLLRLHAQRYHAHLLISLSLLCSALECSLFFFLKKKQTKTMENKVLRRLRKPVHFLVHPCPRQNAMRQTRHCCAAQRVRLRELSPRPLPASVAASSETHLSMSGGKASGKQPRDTAAEDALLQALYHTHKEATRLFFDGGRGVGHRRADSRYATARPSASD